MFFCPVTVIVFLSCYKKIKNKIISNCWLILHQNDKFHELKSPWVSPIDHLILKTLQYVLWSSFHRDKHCRILKRNMRIVMYFALWPVSKNCVLSVMSEMLWWYQTKMWEGALYEKRKWCWEFVKCINSKVLSITIKKKRKKLTKDHVLFTCSKHSQSYFWFESESASSFNKCNTMKELMAGKLCLSKVRE